MRVYLNLSAAPEAGGMHRVWEGLTRYLPPKGIELVATPDQADVYHAHINLYEDVTPSMPLVVSSHGMLWESIWGNAWSTNRHLINSYLQADVVTAPSRFVAQSIARNTLIPARVVQHGIDTERWLPGKSEGYVLWNKARVDPANDPSDMNRLAQLAPSIPFVSTFGVEASNVKLTGLVEASRVLNLVQNAGVYLDTAVESGGPCFGVLEALSCGVPVLAWNNGGNAEAIIHKETGYLAEPGNFSDLYEGLLYCLKNRDQIGANARQNAVEYYQWSIVSEGYLRAYEDAIRAHQHATKVSVIVPCYNLGQFLPHCLDSLINQTFQDWEAIVINDASMDNTAEIARQYVQKDQRITYIENPQNLHVSETRNRGVLASSGEYVLPLDADDRLTPNALELMVNTLDTRRDLHIVTGNLMVHHESDLTTGYNGGWPNNAEYNLQVDGYNRLPYASMYRRHVWKRIGGYRRRIRTGIEDADFWTRALSYGYKAEVLPEVTLLYTHRENSLRTKNPYGADAWLAWFPWAKERILTPYGATGFGPYTVDVFKPEVSVIIPVGPGHAHHIQGCLDSLLAQTETRWEAIVINDTGQPLPEYYTAGYPYVTFVNSDQRGVAHARNVGLAHAATDKIVFLDVDDVAQPIMLDVLLKAHALVDGWVYGDWYTFSDGSVEAHTAPDWSIDAFLQQSLAPITGIYPKSDVYFDEQAPGWEDWDMQLNLLEKGICGTRVKIPLIAYHMDLGARREDNFTQREILIQYIVNKHPKLYGKGATVACSSCGGKRTLNVQMNDTAMAQNDPSDGLVLMEYTGPEPQVRLFKSPSDPTRPPYRVSNQAPFWVLPKDVEHFTNRVDFKRVEKPPTTQAVNQSPVTLPLISEAPRVTANVLTWDSIVVKPEVISILKNNFESPEAVQRASDTELLAVKGIGIERLSAIRKAFAHA